MIPALTGRLVRTAPLEIKLDGSDVIVRARGEHVALGAQGLRLLDAFIHPTHVAEALRGFAVTGTLDFIELTAEIGALVEAGVLIDENATPSMPRQPGRWDAAGAQIDMLRDELRTNAFRHAIAEVVRPGDVVLDLGTGSGILSVFAARAGARRVYAVEASGMAPLAAQVFEKNGVSDRVKLIHGWSTQIELPERADVLITETIGNEPLGERIVDLVFDARRRLLQPNARLIPSALTVEARLVTLSPTLIEHYLCREPNLSFVRDQFQVDLSPLADAEQRSTFPLVLQSDEAKLLEPLSQRFALATIDLATTPLVFQHRAVGTAACDGVLEGVLVSFTAKLSSSIDLTVDGFEIPGSSWRHYLWIVPPRRLKRGDAVPLRYDHAAGIATIDLE